MGELRQKVFALEKSDFAAEWVLKRRVFEETGSKNPLGASEELLAKFFAEYDAKTIEIPALATKEQATALNSAIKKDPELRKKWFDYSNPKGGGIGIKDPKRLPEAFVAAFLGENVK